MKPFFFTHPMDHMPQGFSTLAEAEQAAGKFIGCHDAFGAVITSMQVFELKVVSTVTKRPLKKTA